MKTAYLLIPFVLGGVVACGGGSDNSDSSLQQDNPFTGIWTSEAYGTSYRIQEDKVQIYQHDSRFCLLEDELSDVGASDLGSIFKVDAGGQSMTDPGMNGVLDFHAPATRYDRANTLPAVCEQPVATINQAGYRRDPERDSEIFWQTFNDYYLSFDLKQVDWNDIHQQSLAAVSSDSSDAELMEVFYQMITPLADSHVHITSETLGTASVDGKPTMVERLINEYAESHELTLPLPIDHLQGVNNYIEEQLTLYQAIILSYADDDNQIHRAANDQLVWYMVDNIAYLQINAMAGFSDNPEDNTAELTALEAGLDLVMEDIRDSDGLIVDVRGNNGGHDFLSMAIASRFVGGERFVFSKQARYGNERTPMSEVYIAPRGDLQYLKPVVLLTSNSTVSAAEVFTLMMRSLPQVTLIGESTQGALSDVLDRVLPNGFEFGLSNEFYYSTEDEWFEHTGIPADIEVPFFTVEQRLDQSDAGLEAAYTLLTEN